MPLDDDIHIERCGPAAMDDWVALRSALWPHESADDLRAQARDVIGRGEGAVTFLARSSDGAAIGFAEATLRRDYVNGCATSPVVFLEGLYVVPSWRRRGAAQQLCAAIERWAIDLGCAELGSDTYLDNVDSQRAHEALGFEETERVVFFRKVIAK
jgi:aminoglycoside 6'-N-acetyltransferase I